MDIRVGSGNRLQVYVDNHEGISIDECARLSRALVAKLDRDREDFSLEVSSPGLGSPFRVPEQYLKNLGRQVEVECADGETHLGKLKELKGDRILLELPSGQKGEKPRLKELSLDEIRSAKVHIQF